jgi:hypothetical protein
MIVEIALATETAPSQWWDEDEATLATVLQLLADRAERMARARRGR